MYNIPELLSVLTQKNVIASLRATAT